MPGRGSRNTVSSSTAGAVGADHAELPAVAAAQAARTGWAKVIADWYPEDEPVPVGVLAAVVEAVHAVGGRVAVHSQQAAGGAAAVAAGVDSLEHGMCLDPELLPRMAERGIALTPTLRVLTATLDVVRERPDGPRKDWYLRGATAHPNLVAAAAEAGVTILAGTDSAPHGRVADEIRALAAAGLRGHDALAAGSWAARRYLGLGGLTPGAPADAVVYDADPRTDLTQLDAPSAVILRGRSGPPAYGGLVRSGLHLISVVGLACLVARRGMRNGIGMADGI